MTNSTLKQNDSRQRNLAKSLLKGAVINFGVQALGKNLNKDNFWQTLLVGAAGGLGDYFGGNTAMGAILGGGNALINKSNFLGTTAKYATLSFAADGMLKIAEAKAEELSNDKWKIRIDYHLPGGDLPLYHQKDPAVGCTQETLKSIGEYLRVPIRIWDYPVDWDTNKDGYKNGADFMQLALANGLYVEDVEKKEKKGSTEFYTPDYVGNLLSRNYPMALTYNVPGDLPHTVGVNRILRLQNTVNPKKADKYVIQVMDPLYENGYKTLPFQTFRRSAIIRLVSTKSYA
ncbi:MAG: hypothetical protein K5685_01705 [Bacteroidales bacterium]|nr:hypothetical protein [Bacteroidales bacterium]